MPVRQHYDIDQAATIVLGLDDDDLFDTNFIGDYPDWALIKNDTTIRYARGYFWEMVTRARVNSDARHAHAQNLRAQAQARAQLARGFKKRMKTERGPLRKNDTG